jgi:hypothetical protein
MCQMSADYRKMRYVRRVTHPYTCQFTKSCAEEGFGISFCRDANSDDMINIFVEEPGKFENVGVMKGMKVMAINDVPTWGWKPEELACIVKACEHMNCFEQESLTLWIYEPPDAFCGQSLLKSCTIS